MSSGKVKCTCGWSWNKSDSSKKDMYICHECGRDNSNNMKNGGWLDNYADGGTMQEHQENYNDSKVSLPEGYVGEGYSTKGRNYSPAWGGQFQNGGKAPLYVESKNDPRYIAYQDSLALYKGSNQERVNKLLAQGFKYDVDKKTKSKNYIFTNKDKKDYQKGQVNPKKGLQKIIQDGNDGKKDSALGGKDDKNAQYELMHGKIAPIGIAPLYDDWWRTSQYLYETKNNSTLPGSIYDKDQKNFRKNPHYKAPYATDKTGKVIRNFFNVPIYKKPNLEVRVGEPSQKDLSIDVQEPVIVNPTKFNVEGLQPMSVGIQDADQQIGNPDVNINVLRRGPKGYKYNSVEGGTHSSGWITSPDQLQHLQGLKEMYDEKEYRDWLGTKNKIDIIPQYQMGGSVYPVNYVPQAQDGKLVFLQPTSEKLPEGYITPYGNPSSERAMSIGGENGEPAYLIPSFKYGRQLDDPIGEFKKTGEHLGGPFKTWQEAEEWERTVRHPAVEKKETIMFPQEKFQMGGSIPGAVGFSYARTNDPAPSNGPYAKKTKASAQEGKTLPSVRSLINDTMNRKIQGKGKDVNTVKKDNTKTSTLKEIKKLSGKQQNELAQRLSEEQAAKDWVQNSMQEAYQSPLMSPGYFTPEGMAIGAMQGATKLGPDLYEGDYKGAAMDALTMLPLAPSAIKTATPLIQKAGRALGTEEGLLSNAGIDSVTTIKDIAKAFKNRNKKLLTIGAENLDKELIKKINQLESPEGFGRLVQQETEMLKRDFPHIINLEQQAIRNAQTRISELYQTNLQGNFNANYLQARKLNPNLNPYEFGIPKNNAFFRRGLGSKNIPDGVINLSKEPSLKDDIFSKTFYGAELPGEIAIGREYAESLPVYDHEINHALQNGRNTVLDDELRKFFNNSENLANDLTNEVNKEYSYFRKNKSGAPAREPSSFLAEARRAMLERGLIKDIYEPIGPKKVFEAAKNFKQNPPINSYNNTNEARIFNFAKTDSPQVLKFLSNSFNKLPAAVPVGLGLGAASQLDQKREGGVVKDDMGYWNPDNWDSPVEIGSNEITMKHVPFDVLGISDEGDIKHMKPGKNYKYKGKKVTEFRMAKNGLRQEQKGLVNLDNLTNFTNYNTKQPGGWLDQY